MISVITIDEINSIKIIVKYKILSICILIRYLKFFNIKKIVDITNIKYKINPTIP